MTAGATTCGERVVQLLEAYGVEVAFGIPGVHTVELLRGIAGSRLRFVTPRHEQGAGFMADGYARVTGRPAVCFTITGPGATNVMTAMGQALADSVPMLVIGSVNPTHQLGLGHGQLHELPGQRQAMAHAAVWAHTLMRPDELPEVFARAFGIFSCARPGPVYLELPLDVIAADSGPVPAVAWPVPAAPGPDAAAIARAVTLINAARRPLLVIGGGTVDAGQAAREVAERFDLPVVATQNGKGVIHPSHPLYVGGSPTLPAVREELRESDVLLAVGTELGETDFDFFFKGDLALPDTVIRVDVDAAQLSRNAAPAVAVLADAALALSELANGAAPQPRAETGAARAAAVRTRLADARDNRYQRFLDTLAAALPDMILVGDSTQPVYYAAMQYEPVAPRSFFHSATGYGTLGYGLPAAMGAKLAAPSRPVVCLIGDGGVLFTLGELASAVDEGIDVIVIVWNNDGYGEIRTYMRDAGVTPVGVDLRAPDFQLVARGFGFEAVRAQSLSELRTALQEAEGPTLIEVRELDMLV